MFTSTMKNSFQSKGLNQFHHGTETKIKKKGK